VIWSPTQRGPADSAGSGPFVGYGEGVAPTDRFCVPVTVRERRSGSGACRPANFNFERLPDTDGWGIGQGYLALADPNRAQRQRARRLGTRLRLLRPMPTLWADGKCGADPL
jgi:hypothetical protein